MENLWPAFASVVRNTTDKTALLSNGAGAPQGGMSSLNGTCTMPPAVTVACGMIFR